MITITRRLEIDAGHRLRDHEGKCRNVHGHRYRFDVTVLAPKLDALGRVIDFSVIKAKLGGWLDAHWDHACIVEDGDPLLDWLRGNDARYYVTLVPPTAENLAAIVLAVARGLLRPHDIEVVRVRCYETPNCWSDAA